MAGEWGTSPLGNLAQFEIPQFKTGEGLAAIMALRQRQMENQQDQAAYIAKSLGEAMAQRRQDAIANAAADQMAKMYGIDIPKEEGFLGGLGGQAGGEDRAEMLAKLIKQQQQAELLRARIARANRPAATGGGGGGGGGRGAPSVDEPTTKWDSQGREWYKNTSGGWSLVRGGAAGSGGSKASTKSEDVQLQHDVLLQRQKDAEDNLKLITSPRKPGQADAPLPADIKTAQDAINASNADLRDFRFKNLGNLKRSGVITPPGASAGPTPPPRTAGADGTATDSKQALARQALADPNATEAEKAQARKILGQ